MSAQALTEPGDNAPAWKIGTLLKGALDSLVPAFWRLVYIDSPATDRDDDSAPSSRMIYVLRVEPGATPHSTAIPKRYRFDYAASRLTAVAECVRLPAMSAYDASKQLTPKTGAALRFEQIAPLVSVDKLSGTMNRNLRATRISEQAAAFGLTPVQVRKLLTRYWWYGCDESALIDLTTLQGGPGKRRLTAGSEKRGAPNAFAKEDPDSRHRGVNVDARHEHLFLQALHVFWIGRGLSLAETYQEMREVLYRTQVTRKDGTVVYRRTPGHRIPTLGQFYEHARALIALHGLKGKNLGDLDRATKVQGRGGTARDIATGPGDIFDMDSTEFNFELVASFDPTRRIGKPTVYLVVDRASSAILGVYLDCRPERWEGYRRALYCAFTPKDTMLQRVGLFEEFGNIWPLHAVPNGIFADRGPARSIAALQALCEELKLTKAAPPPHRPDLNAVVESLQGKLQKVLSRFPGGYRRTRDQRAKKRHSDSRWDAMFTEEDFLALLILAIHDHNADADVSRLLTPAMNRVKGVPQSIFKWGVKNSPVEHVRHVDHAALYAKLLPIVEDRAVTTKGIRYEKRYYNSTQLQQWRGRQKTSKPKTSIHIDADPRYVYWRPEPNEWSELVMRDQDQAALRHMRWTDVELYATRNAKQHINRAASSSKVKLLPRGAEEVLRKAAERQGDNPTPYKPAEQSVSTNRRLAALKQRSGQEADGREVMRGLTSKQPSTPAMPPKQPSKPTPPRLPGSAASIADLYKKKFTK